MRSATSIGTLIMLILWATAAQFAEAGVFWRFNLRWMEDQHSRVALALGMNRLTGLTDVGLARVGPMLAITPFICNRFNGMEDARP